MTKKKCLDITYEDLEMRFHRPLSDVAKEFGVCMTFLKKFCRSKGIMRWPFRQVNSINKKDKSESIDTSTSANELGRAVAATPRPSGNDPQPSPYVFAVPRQHGAHRRNRSFDGSFNSFDAEATNPGTPYGRVSPPYSAGGRSSGALSGCSVKDMYEAGHFDPMPMTNSRRMSAPDCLTNMDVVSNATGNTSPCTSIAVGLPPIKELMDDIYDRRMSVESNYTDSDVFEPVQAETRNSGHNLKSDVFDHSLDVPFDMESLLFAQ